MYIQPRQSLCFLLKILKICQIATSTFLSFESLGRNTILSDYSLLAREKKKRENMYLYGISKQRRLRRVLKMHRLVSAFTARI